MPTSPQQPATLTIDQALSQAIAHHKQGQLQDAERLYRGILQIQPNHPDANHNLGAIAVQTMQPLEAVPHFKAALEVNRNMAQYWLSYIDALIQSDQIDVARQVLTQGREWGLKGESIDALADRLEDSSGGIPSPQQMDRLVALSIERRYPEAATIARAMTARFPQHAFGWKVLGAVYQQMGQSADALAPMQKAVALAPNDAQAQSNLGNALRGLGRLEEAEASHRRALQIKPDFTDAYINLGSTLKDLGRLDEALVSYQQALQIRPDFAEAHVNLGNILKDVDRIDEAAASYQRALQIRPDYAEAHCNLGVTFHVLRRLSEAEASFRRAIALRPGFAQAHTNLGITLHDLHRPAEAEASFRHAVEFQPDFAQGHSNLGNSLKERGRLIEAESCYRRALELEPKDASVWQFLSTIKGFQSDFTEVKALSDTALGLSSSDMTKDYGIWENRLWILSYHPDLSAGEILSEFVRWGDLQDCSASSARHDNDRNPRRRLRVGYVSPDFRHHTMRFYYAPLFEHHDRNSVEIFAYSNVKRPDHYTERFRKMFDHWRDIAPLSDEAAAPLVRQDGIDILVDGCNHMRDDRLGLFARKPAPLQVTWGGAAWTSGLPTMDYVLFDPHVAPAGTLAREAIVRLPRSFVAFRPREDFGPVGAAPCVRNGYVTFGYYGRTERLNHLVFRLWGRILAALPDARLILDFRAFGDPLTREYYRGFLAKHGVDVARVALRHSEDVSKALNDIDIMLDSFPHCGGTMSYDAVCMGVPLLTLAARPPLGRIGAGIMSNLGLGQWVAADEASYLGKAVAFARNMAGLAEVRSGMRERIAASAWRDEAGYARDVEKAYREMWRRWCAGEAAGPFDVA